MPVRVDVLARDPGIGAAHVDAELLVQFARERARGRLAGFHFAAGEFPVARVHLAVRALRQQETAVGPLDHRRGDFNHFLAWRPAQSRANW